MPRQLRVRNRDRGPQNLSKEPYCCCASDCLFDPSVCTSKMVELIGIEPTTSGLQSPRSPN